jgi:hypothetical protein
MGNAYPIEYTEIMQLIRMSKGERMRFINKLLSREPLGEYNVFKNKFEEVTP